MKIMVVDDQPEILVLIRRMLEPLGCEVLTLADSREAAKQVNVQSFDAVFLDVKMPHLDGFQLTRSVRSSPLNCKVPIVMLTGFDDFQTMREGFKAGATYFLGKPISMDRIHGLFNAVLGPMLAQRRKYARLPFQTIVNCACGEGSEGHFVARSMNIGEGGMLIESATSIKVAQSLSLEFLLPSSDQPLRILGKVHRMTPPDRYGVEFVRPSPTDQETIQRYILGAVHG